MARSVFVFFAILVLFSSLVSSSHGRKLLTAQEHITVAPSLEDRLYLNALPKGTVTPSSPSKKGHVMVVDEKLIARHLIAIDRILQSVPSPGIGH